MSATGLLDAMVKPMRDHLDKVIGNTGAGSGAAEAFDRANNTLTDLSGQHDSAARTALGGWYGQQAGLFQERSAAIRTATTTLAANCATAATVANAAASAVNDGRTAIQGLIDEFIGKATPMLQGADAALADGDQGAYQRAVASAGQLAGEYSTK